GHGRSAGAVEVVGGRQAGRQVRGIDRELEGACRQVIEAVAAVRAGDGGVAHVVATAGRAVRPVPRESHTDTDQAGLAGILHTVTVYVEPDAIAEAAGAVEAEVDIVAIGARDERE